MPKKPRCPNGSRRKPRKTGKCVKNTKKKKLSTTQKSFLKGIKSKSKSKSKTLTLPSSKSKSKSKSKTKKKGNYRSFLKCEMKRLKKANPNVRQASIMKMAAKNWNKA
tara:strand:- start:793 stop:1116 length:324 start_codon:yes stop_codon:yes gene_type:complete